MIENDLIVIQPTTDVYNEYKVPRVGDVKGGATDANSGRLYGLPQAQLGLRARSRPNEVLAQTPRTIADFLQGVSVAILPLVDSKYDLGSVSRSWEGVYANSYFTGTGAEILMFKNITAPAGGTIVADTLIDTYNLTSSDGSVVIENDPATDTTDFKVSTATSENTIQAFAFFIS